MQDHAGDVDNNGVAVVDRSSYARSVTVTISRGNYNIEELLAEVKLKLNAACTAANVATREFRTFLRRTEGGGVRRQRWSHTGYAVCPSERVQRRPCPA